MTELKTVPTTEDESNERRPPKIMVLLDEEGDLLDVVVKPNTSASMNQKSILNLQMAIQKKKTDQMDRKSRSRSVAYHRSSSCKTRSTKLTSTLRE